VQEFTNKDGHRYAPKLEILCLSTGKIQQIKIKSGIFDNNPIMGGDIIYCENFTHEDSVKFVDGNFVKDDSKPKTWWLNVYKILTKEEIEKLLD
jgi:hypothetical protein